jgi:benzoylsuccinyl-CoA thiolase BbsA subunit
MSALQQHTQEDAPPAWPDLWNRDREGAYLVAGRCEQCNGQALGLREFCPHCLARGSMREARVGRSGRVYSATVIHQGPSGYKTPYRVGYVDIEDNMRMFAHLENGPDAPAIGDLVTLDIRPLAADKSGHLMTVPVYVRRRAENPR